MGFYTRNAGLIGTGAISARVGIHDIIVAQQIPIVTGGQIEYTTPGTYSWLCPAGVTSVCVVCVGGGGGGMQYVSGAGFYPMSGGGGGALGWKNNISVVPGTSYSVVVGAGGAAGE